MQEHQPTWSVVECEPNRNEEVNLLSSAIKEVLDAITSPGCPSCGSPTQMQFRDNQILERRWIISCVECGNYLRSDYFQKVIALWDGGCVDGNWRTDKPLIAG